MNITAQDERFIISYFNRLNLKPSKDNKEFWKNLYQKYGNEKAKSLADVVDARIDNIPGINLYEAKNETLELSLDYARYSADLYRRYFEWLICKKELNPKRILDIGCDNGIVTCFYAILFPNSEVIGVDISENGIKCAKQLSEKLGLTNVKFMEIGFRNIKEHFFDQQFDIITSVRSLHEIMEDDVDIRYWSLNEVLVEVEKQEENMLFKQISNLLRHDESIFISWERFSSPGIALWWIEKYKRVGLYVNWEECDKIKFHEVEDIQMMPVIVYNKINNETSTMEGLIKLYIKGDLIDIKKKKIYLGESAEALFTNFTEKEFIGGLQINNLDGAEKLRFEMWKLKNQLLIYQYSNIGQRELRILPLELIETARNELYSIDKIYQTDRNKILHYDSMKERDEFDQEN